jgi:DNA repair ATPase RecN
MRVAYVKLCGFRGYSKALHIEFARGFTVIDGRNGVGKSSIFDAIEFVLLGTIQKYDHVSAAGETANDYIWWRGPGSSPTERFVEVGFEIDGEIIPLRRTMLEGPDAHAFERVSSSLLSLTHAPPQALIQLCGTSIIRDEKIAALSLDLKESDRFKQLRDALGASDAEEWIGRASGIHDLAKRRRAVAEQELNQAAQSASLASVRLEETRRSIPDPRILDEATARLRAFSGLDSPDQFRQAVAARQSKLDHILRFENSWPEIVAARELIERTAADVARAAEARNSIAAREEELRTRLGGDADSAGLSGTSQLYATLLTSGENVGLQNGHCPLCAANRTPAEFASGIELGRRKVQELDAKALQRAELEQEHHRATLQLHAADAELARVKSSVESAQSRLTDFAAALADLDLKPETELEQLRQIRQQLQQELAQARQDLSIVETMRLAASIDSQVGALESAQARRRRQRNAWALRGAPRAGLRRFSMQREGLRERF